MQQMDGDFAHKIKGNFEGVYMRTVNRGGNKMKAKQEG